MDPLAELAAALPEGRVVSGGEDLERHAGGIFTYHAPVKPDAVVYPQSRDEVVEILRFAHEHRVPIVPFGQGNSLEAHTIPVRGGVSLDLARMKRILEIRPDDFIARVQPGLTHGTPSWPITGSTFRWTPAGTPRWVGWPAPTRAGRTRSSTGLCATGFSASKWCWRRKR